MLVVNHFDQLGLDAKEILRLSDGDAERCIKKAYSGLYNAHNVNEDNARKNQVRGAKEYLLDPVRRVQHAQELGLLSDRQPEPAPAPAPAPYTEPYPEPYPRPRFEQDRRDDAGPSRSRVLIGALAAVPAVVVYLAASRINESDEGRSFGAIVSLALFWLLGYRRFGLFFLAGLGAFVLPVSVVGFSKVTHAMSLPWVGVVFFTLGVFMLPSIFAAMLRSDSTPGSGWPRHLATVTFWLLVAVGSSVYVVGLGLPSVPEDVGITDGEPERPVVPPGEPQLSPRETEDRLGLDRAQRRGIQAGLQAAGFYGGAVDGLFGPATRRAIRDWQRRQSGVASGFVNGLQAQVLAALAPSLPPESGTRPGTVDPPEPPVPASSGSRVVVRAEPNSRIAVDTEARGTTNEDGMLRLDGLDPGGHILVAEKLGYETVTRNIDVEAGRSQVVELVLRELPGTLDVRVNVDGAFVAIDGGEALPLPLVGFDAPSGTRQVTVVRQGYQSVVRYVEVRSRELASVDIVLEPVDMEAEIARVRARFERADYADAVELGFATAANLELWLSDGLDVARPLGALYAILGQSFYALDRFQQSVQLLYQAIDLGQEVVLPINHRHGGGGIREGFCRGFLTLSREEIAFRSTDDPDHGFAVSPQGLSGVQITQRVNRQTFRLDTEVRDRGDRRRNVDFVHPDAQRRQQDPDGGLVVELVCPGCDASFDVHVMLLQRLSQL